MELCFALSALSPAGISRTAAIGLVTAAAPSSCAESRSVAPSRQSGAARQPRTFGAENARPEFFAGSAGIKSNAQRRRTAVTRSITANQEESGRTTDTPSERKLSESMKPPPIPAPESSANGNRQSIRRSEAFTQGMPVARFVDDSRLRILAGPSNEPLAQEVADYIGVRLGKCVNKTFADGETYVKIEDSVRGCDVFIIQPTSAAVNNRLMELLIMIDACRRASARSIAAVIPYYGYARADKLHPNKTPGREAITAKLVANLITAAGTSRVLAIDLHSAQMQGYFDIPLDHVYASPVLLDYLQSKNLAEDLVVVSPDIGGVGRARAFAKKLGGAPLAIVDKRRQEHNQCEVMNLIGDVRGKVAVLVDDMIDTAGTLYNGAKFLREQGAREVYACATHAVLSPPAVERLSSGYFEEVIVTNTINIPEESRFPQLKILSVANLLGETILRVHEGCSVAPLFF
eukprot:tig00021537_g22271.t1